VKTKPVSQSEYHHEFKGKLAQIASVLGLKMRKKMYQVFEQVYCHPTSVLDVGATCEQGVPEANFFEELFPFKNRITACGIEDASHLEKRYPGLKFIPLKLGQALPFQNQEFEVGFSNAVIEHVGGEPEREIFLREILRVSKKIFVTTPNKYFPFEVHTLTPIIHFLTPRLFHWMLDRGWISKFYSSKNLQPLGQKDLARLAKRLNLDFEIRRLYLFGFCSNLVLIAKSRN
jgi:hypothetical protein